MSDEAITEAQRLISEALAKFGVAGEIAIQGRTATLHGHGPTASADLGVSIEDWGSISDEARRRRALDVARQLAAVRRKLTQPAPPLRRGSGLGATLGVVFAGAVVGGGLFKLYGTSSPPAPARASARPSASVDYDRDEQERRDRAERVCEATRARVRRGAPVGPADAEGWVVDLEILRSPDRPQLIDAPELDVFLKRPNAGADERLVWPGSPTLAALDGPGTAVHRDDATISEGGAALFRGVRVELSSRYVAPYFDSAGRAEYLRFAKALTEALGADYAALYARCAQSKSHNVGTYFRGPNPGGAVAALLYFMGTSLEAPDVRPSLLTANGNPGADPGAALQNILASTSPLKKSRVMDMIGKDEGMISGLDGQPSAIGFGYRDPNLAARACGSVARSLGIAADP